MPGKVAPPPPKPAAESRIPRSVEWESREARAPRGGAPLPFLVAVGVVVVALVAGGVVLATRSTRAPAPAPATPPVTTRAVAFGDSVPYGHGLANPYLTPQRGLPPSAVSQGPSTQAYPSLVARNLHLDMTVRPTNCDLVGDQLAISGAVADPADNRSLDGQCPRPPRPARNLEDEVAAAGLDRHPARLVLMEDGADDIHFAQCLVYDLVHVLGLGPSLGTRCVSNGTVTKPVADELANVRRSLAAAIELASAARRGPWPCSTTTSRSPARRRSPDDTGASGLGTNLVCAGHQTGRRGHLRRRPGRPRRPQPRHRRRGGRCARPSGPQCRAWSTSRPSSTGTACARPIPGSSPESGCPT